MNSFLVIHMIISVYQQLGKHAYKDTTCNKSQFRSTQQNTYKYRIKRHYQLVPNLYEILLLKFN